jgi:chemotaxis methyl-accepting protein methylase
MAPFLDVRRIPVYEQGWSSLTETDKVRMFRNIGRCLAKDGCLIIGSTESISGLCPEFEPKRHMRSVFYQLKESSSAAR